MDRVPSTATKPWQYAVSAVAVATVVTLAAANAWPFDAVPAVGGEPSFAELAFGDRLTIGLIRLAVLALVVYVVVSVPALVLERRWIQGMTTSGLTTDAERVDDQWKLRIETRMSEIADVLATQGRHFSGVVRSTGTESSEQGEVRDDED